MNADVEQVLKKIKMIVRKKAEETEAVSGVA